jgi:hypothetical protein
LAWAEWILFLTDATEMDEHGESTDALMDGMGKREVPMPKVAHLCLLTLVIVSLAEDMRLVYMAFMYITALEARCLLLSLECFDLEF